MRPRRPCRHGQGSEYFQHIGQLTGKVVGGGAAYLLGLFYELGQQRLAVARLRAVMRPGQAGSAGTDLRALGELALRDSAEYEGGSSVLVLSHPEWWLDHVDELVDALDTATTLPDVDELIRDDEVALSHPGWWAEHPNELRAALQEATRELEPWLDLDAELQREHPPPEPPSHEREIGR